MAVKHEADGRSVASASSSGLCLRSDSFLKASLCASPRVAAAARERCSSSAAKFESGLAMHESCLMLAVGGRSRVKDSTSNDVANGESCGSQAASPDGFDGTAGAAAAAEACAEACEAEFSERAELIGTGMLELARPGRPSSSCLAGTGVRSLTYRRSDSSTWGVGWLNHGVGKLSTRGGSGTGIDAGDAGRATGSCRSMNGGSESGTDSTIFSTGRSQQKGVGWLSGRCWLSGADAVECALLSS
mmetsp:Transcript_119522/g.283797  ORF Transcript_119522/g.283797 Transcript_119522/m.283797 type:complete len:245 (+) Transcript_119522:160-894(+)